MDVEPFLAIKEKLNNWNRMDFVVHAAMVDLQPQFTRVSRAVHFDLGEFTTEYNSARTGANLAMVRD